MTEDERAASAERLTGYRFVDLDVVRAALTHKSWLHENPGDGPHNERLEYLGDAVLDLVAAEVLFTELPDAAEGELTRRRAAWVSEAALAEAGRHCAIGELLRLGRGQRRGGGSDHTAIIADAMEALIGAVFVDGGYASAREAVFSLLGDPPTEDQHQAPDVKNALQENLQARYAEEPRYEVERAGGSEHEPIFHARVRFRGQTLGEGEGRNSKEATRAAAAAALAGLADPDEA